MLLAAGLEAGFSLIADRMQRERVVSGGLFALCAALLGCALASTGTALTLSLGLAGAASGVACAAAQAELVSADPGQAERTLTRWTLFAALGDVSTPLVLAAVLAVGGSYRGAFVGIALLVFCHASLVLSNAKRASSKQGVVSSAPTQPLEADAPEPLLRALAAGARTRWLWWWLAGAAICTLLDEIIVAFAMLRMERDLAFSGSSAALGATLFSLGGACGALITERLLTRFDSSRLLVVSAVACATSLVAVVFATTLGSLLPALFVLGASAAPEHALLTARAYASLPGRPGVVNALGQLFVVFDIAAPIALGAVADAFGLPVALACLVIQPCAVLALVVSGRSRIEH